MPLLWLYQCILKMHSTDTSFMFIYIKYTTITLISLSSIFEQVGIYFKSHTRPLWLEKTANDSKKSIKVISALIKENTTVSAEDINHRFQIIALAVGTKYQNNCSKGITDICDGHAESLCYNAAPIYFQTQLKKMMLNEPSILYLTEDGYAVKPFYNFLLLVSRPSCGFLSNDNKHLLSWKIPFDNQPHIPECSSRILINSYLGIQGPLTVAFAEPIYIKDIIFLDYKELHVEGRHFAVLTDLQAVQKKLIDFERKIKVFKTVLQARTRFRFCKPKISILKLKPKELDKHFDEELCNFSLDNALSDTSMNCCVSILSEIGNKGQIIISLTKEKKVLKKDRNEQGEIHDLWKDIKDKLLKNLPSSQLQHCLKEYQEALQMLYVTLEMDIAVAKAKDDLKDKIQYNNQIMQNYFNFLKENFEEHILIEKEYQDTQKQEEIMSKFCSMPNIFHENKVYSTMITLLEKLKCNIELLDCASNKFYLLMEKIGINNISQQKCSTAASTNTTSSNPGA